MRVERVYWLERGRGNDRARGDFYIHTQETSFCEDRQCEREHDDPSKLYDFKREYCLGKAYGEKNANQILEALRGSQANETR